MVVLSPISTLVTSPSNFRSCGAAEMTAPGKILQFLSNAGSIHDGDIAADPGTFTDLQRSGGSPKTDQFLRWWPLWRCGEYMYVDGS